MRYTPYFAYGSNIPSRHMSSRCSDAVEQRRARLDGWALAFSGCADVRRREGASVEGAVWMVSDADLRRLDTYEGTSFGDPWSGRHGFYYRVWVDVVTEDGETVRAIMYVMTEQNSRRLAMPSQYYLDVIREGYEELGIDTAPLKVALEECCLWLGEHNVGTLVEDGKKRWVPKLERDARELERRSAEQKRRRRREQLDAERRRAEARAAAGYPMDDGDDDEWVPDGFRVESARDSAKAFLLAEGMLDSEAEAVLDEVDHWAEEIGEEPDAGDYLAAGFRSNHQVETYSDLLERLAEGEALRESA